MTDLPVLTPGIIRYWLAGERKMRPVIAHRIRQLAAEGGSHE